MKTQRRYADYASYIRALFGERVQKISINTGYSCPNRDGSKGYGGCTYCNIHTFSPDYCKPQKTVTQQLNEGVQFFSSRYKAQKYLAYFQSYTNTYASLDILRQTFEEALSHPDVVGLVIGTRPDCISEDIVQMLSDFVKRCYVSLEFGVESTINRTLERVNRCHTFEETKAAYAMADGKGIALGAHLILGLPGEDEADMLGHAYALSALPIHTLKIHQLQIVRHTRMAMEYAEDSSLFHLFSADEYIDFVSRFVAVLRPDIVIERFSSESPGRLLIAPQWNGIKNFELTHRIEQRMQMLDLWQGKHYVDRGKLAL